MPKLLINLYGAPGAGKTFWAQALAEALGGRYVPEYASHLIATGRAGALADQVGTTGGQAQWIQEALDEYDVVITDSPCDLGYVYYSDPEHLAGVREYVDAIEEDVITINIFVLHNEVSIAAFTTEGRVHGLEQALALQGDIASMLGGTLLLEGTQNGVPYSFVPDAKPYMMIERGMDLDVVVDAIKDMPEWNAVCSEHGALEFA